MSNIQKVLKDLLSFAERNVCFHENTHRGGAIWEICDDCGAQWADDRGGKPDFVYPPELEAAQSLLKELESTEANDKAVAVVEHYKAIDNPEALLQKVHLLTSVPNGSKLYLKGGESAN